MARPVHPDKDIEAAVAFAESRNWRCELRHGYAWTRLFWRQTENGWEKKA
jgi:hypothetical protein